MQCLTVDQLFYQFQLNSKLQFTGRLDVKSALGHAWSLYFQLGHLIWAVGSVNRFERWYCSLQQFCPTISVERIWPSRQTQSEQGALLWEYLMLTSWVKQQRISRNQVAPVIENAIAEVMLDILQNAENIEQLATTADQKSPEQVITAISAEKILRETLQFLEGWCDAGLADYSANLSLVLKCPEALQKQASPNTYLKLKSLLNGHFTLRRMALATQQNVRVVICSFAPYIQQGLIGLQDPPSLKAEDPAASPKQVVETPSRQGAATNHPGLILCVDDSPQICRTMEQILTSAGYRFLGVQNPLQALPTALRQKPDLIFLDLVMPVANGYEICAQLRQVSALKDVPVVILTGKDGIVDRVRAKMVDASGFLAKPVDVDKILGTVQRYLKSDVAVNPTSKTHKNHEHSKYSFIS